MILNIDIDIEDEIRRALTAYGLTAYCRPLPAEYDLPHILITQVGGTVANTVSTFEVVIDARAELEADAIEYLNHAKAILEHCAKHQSTALRHIVVNSSGSWGTDPVRPDLAMCSARLSVTAHQEEAHIDEPVNLVDDLNDKLETHEHDELVTLMSWIKRR